MTPLRKTCDFFRALCKCIYSYLRPKKCKCEMRLSDQIIASSDGRYVRLHEPSRLDNGICNLYAYNEASGDKGRAWCNTLRAALNHTLYDMTPSTLAVDYVKVYHKTGLKLFVVKDKTVPIQFFSRP